MSTKGRIFSIIILSTIFFVTGCTNQTSTQELEKEIEKLNTELKAMKEKNEELGKYIDNLSPNLQVLDRSTRGILKLIESQDYDGMKEQYGFSFSEKDGVIEFQGVETNMPFNSDLAGLIGHIGYYHGLEKGFHSIAYYFYNEEGTKVGLIVFKYDNQFQLKEIALGDT